MLLITIGTIDVLLVDGDIKLVDHTYDAVYDGNPNMGVLITGEELPQLAAALTVIEKLQK